MEIIEIKTKIFNRGDSLDKFIVNNLKNLEEGSVLAITSKIVALSQNRVGLLRDKSKLIKQESKVRIKTPWADLTLTDDGWGINSGIDESNSRNELILLPKNPQLEAARIQKKLSGIFSLKHLGVIITDTRSVPLRVGTIGRAIGFSGFKALKSYIGKPDLFGRKSRLTESNLADALAAMAVLVMGEGDEQIPLVIIKGATLEFIKVGAKQGPLESLSLAPADDIFAQVFQSTSRESRKQTQQQNHRKS